MIGTNESGKTNLLIGLWKLNPANNEAIVPLIDYPRKKYVDYAKTNGEEIFVSGHYQLNEASVKVIRGLFKKEPVVVAEQETTEEKELGVEEEGQVKKVEAKKPEPIEIATSDEVSELILHRKYNGTYSFGFPKMKEETRIQIKLSKKVQDQILETIPKFVYYSDYGNLDSEIYLPHVISNFQRTDLGIKEREKVRSLKVLFEFVKLSPEDILRLGQERFEVQTTIKVHHHNPAQEVSRESVEVKPTEGEIEQQRQQKKEREILLQSASTKLTQEFRTWWKQGDYR